MTRRRSASLRIPLQIHTHAQLGAQPSAAITHAHLSGACPHAHPDHGPAAFTIDKDEWYVATGLKGGSRKPYSEGPSGPQLPWVAPERTTFTVVFEDTGYSAEYARAGISEAEYERTRAEFEAAAAGQAPVAEEEDETAGRGGAAVARMALGFGLTPIYVYIPRTGPAEPADLAS